jgi:hypothetical protein
MKNKEVAVVEAGQPLIRHRHIHLQMEEEAQTVQQREEVHGFVVPIQTIQPVGGVTRMEAWVKMELSVCGLVCSLETQ